MYAIMATVYFAYTYTSSKIQLLNDSVIILHKREIL